MRQQALDGFCKAYGSSAEGLRVFFAPGRVNLIGEHVDYNGGMVLPCALNVGTYVAVLPRSDRTIRLSSASFKPYVEINLDDISYKPDHGWANYPKGVVSVLSESKSCSGFDMYVAGDLPNGAGLSSSASLCMAVAFALNTIFNLCFSGVELAQVCQKAEAYNGVNCGIMDPFASAMGKFNHAILLNCSSLIYTHIPFDLGDYRIVIANSNKKRELADSKYNERRMECEAALKDLQKVPGLEAVRELCELYPEEFDVYKSAIKDPVSLKRAEHVIYENFRTEQTARCFSSRQWEELPELMSASHKSLRDLYEVSCKELDALFCYAYEHGRTIHPIYGARMTGAGFGGCIVSFVHKDFTDSFASFVGERYFGDTGLEADFYVVSPWDGAKEIH